MATILLSLADAHADCVRLPFSVTQSVVERFIFNQQTLLRDSPRGGEGLVNATSILAMVSRATPPQIMKVSKAASADQRTAIGAGLGIAAARCKPKHPDVTLTLERLMRDSGDSIMQRAFAEKLKFDGVLSNERLAMERSQAVRDQLNKAGQPGEYRRTFNVTEPGSTGPIPGIGATPPIRPVQPVQPLR